MSSKVSPDVFVVSSIKEVLRGDDDDDRQFTWKSHRRVNSELAESGSDAASIPFNKDVADGGGGKLSAADKRVAAVSKLQDLNQRKFLAPSLSAFRACLSDLPAGSPQPVRLADGSIHFDEEHDALFVPHLVQVHPQLKHMSSFATKLCSADASLKMPAGGGGIIWHACLSSLREEEIKPRRPLPEINKELFFSNLSETSDGRWIL